MNGKSYRGKPFVYDAETPGPADRRDVLALRSDFYRFQEENDAALAALLAERFALEWEFLDVPNPV